MFISKETLEWIIDVIKIHRKELDLHQDSLFSHNNELPRLRKRIDILEKKISESQ